MTFMKDFVTRIESVGIQVTNSGDTWVTTPVGIFTHPESDHVLFAPNSLMESPGMVSWIALAAVQIAKEIDPSVTVMAADECYPLNAEYTEFESDPKKVSELTVKSKHMRVLHSAQALLANANGQVKDNASRIIMPDTKVITDV